MSQYRFRSCIIAPLAAWPRADRKGPAFDIKLAERGFSCTTSASCFGGMILPADAEEDA